MATLMFRSPLRNSPCLQTNESFAINDKVPSDKPGSTEKTQKSKKRERPPTSSGKEHNKSPQKKQKQSNPDEVMMKIELEPDMKDQDNSEGEKAKDFKVREWPKIPKRRPKKSFPEVINHCEGCTKAMTPGLVLGCEYSADEDDLEFLKTLETPLTFENLVICFENILSCLEHERRYYLRNRSVHKCLKRLLIRKITAYWKEKRKKIRCLVRKHALNEILNWKNI